MVVISLAIPSDGRLDRTQEYQKALGLNGNHRKSTHEVHEPRRVMERVVREWQRVFSHLFARRLGGGIRRTDGLNHRKTCEPQPPWAEPLVDGKLKCQEKRWVPGSIRSKGLCRRAGKISNIESSLRPAAGPSGGRRSVMHFENIIVD